MKSPPSDSPPSMKPRLLIVPPPMGQASKQKLLWKISLFKAQEMGIRDVYKYMEQYMGGRMVCAECGRMQELAWRKRWNRIV